MTKLHTKPLISVVAALLIAAAAGACTQTRFNEDHCAAQEGDAYCLDQFGDAAAYCQLPDCNGDAAPKFGCVAEPPADECQSVCGHEIDYDADGNPSLGEPNMCEVGDGDGDPTGDGDGDPTGDGDGDGDGDTLCMGPADCTDPMAPFCDLDSGQCVSCGATADPDGTCAGSDPEHPLCEAGVCVACAVGHEDACEDETPICDTDTNVCVACTAHEQCGDGACNFDLGSCFESSELKHVDGDNPACTLSGPGTPGSPYCTLKGALASLGYKKFIMLHETANPYNESVVVSGWVAIFAAPYQAPKMRPLNGQPGILVQGYLFARGLEISYGTNGSLGVDVRGQAWIERANIVNNAGGGIVVYGGGTLVLENSFVGTAALNVSAIDVLSGEISVVYSTLGTAGAVGSPALSCTDGAGMVRNSILVALMGNPEIDCAGVTIASSALEAPIGDNIALGNMDLNWFVDFGNGNFHLSGNHPAQIETAASWQTGDPTTDIDGDPRPMTNGSPDFAGADNP